MALILIVLRRIFEDGLITIPGYCLHLTFGGMCCYRRIGVACVFAGCPGQLSLSLFYKRS